MEAVLTASAPLRRLGRSAVHVSPIGLGGAPYAAVSDAASDAESKTLIEDAYRGGISYFDTAPLYGVGLSERRLGNGLRYLDASNVAISTKVGRWLAPRMGALPVSGSRREFETVIDYSYDGAMRSLEQSLQRLGTSRIDILLIHDVDIWTHGSREAYEQRLREAMNGAYRALLKLRDERVVGAIGIGVNEIEPCLSFARAADLDCMMLAGRYTLLEHEGAAQLLSLCQQKQISLLIAGPYNSGILATGATPSALYNYRPAPTPIVNRVRAIEALARRHGAPIAACALQFPLAHPAVAAVVPGAFNRTEVERNLAMMATPIPPALWDELKESGLLAADAATPRGPPPLARRSAAPATAGAGAVPQSDIGSQKYGD
jgi:D-threo-aldose 1-dehydrogenase